MQAMIASAGPRGEQAPELLKSPLHFLEETRRRHGGLVSLVLGGERVVLVSDPAATRQVVVDDADTWIKEGTAFFPGSALAGNGLLVSDGDLWKRQRRLSNPAFRQAAVRRSFHVIKIVIMLFSALDCRFHFRPQMAGF
jgi:cytochrome P450